MPSSVSFTPPVIYPPNAIIPPSSDPNIPLFYTYASWYGNTPPAATAYTTPVPAYLDFLSAFGNPGTVTSYSGSAMSNNQWTLNVPGSNVSFISVYTEDLWNIFFTEFFPLTQDNFNKDPTSYQQMFHMYLSDYVTRYIVIDNTQVLDNGYLSTQNAMLNPPLPAVQKFSNYIAATDAPISTTNHSTAFRNYLSTVGSVTNTGPHLPYYSALLVNTTHTDPALFTRKNNVALWIINFLYQLLAHLSARGQQTNNIVTICSNQQAAAQAAANFFTSQASPAALSAQLKSTWNARASNVQSLLQTLSSTQSNLQQTLNSGVQSSQQLFSLINSFLGTYLDVRTGFTQ